MAPSIPIPSGFSSGASKLQLANHTVRAGVGTFNKEIPRYESKILLRAEVLSPLLCGLWK